MSGSFPSTPVWSAVGMKSNAPTLVSETASGRMQSRKIAGQRWEFSASFPPMTRADFMPVWAFVVKQRGSHETFTVVPPVISNSRGVATGTPLVKTAHAVGATSITTDGWTISQTGILKAGDFIKFGHSKVYMVTADTNSDASGDSTVLINPPLATALSDNESVTVNSVPFTVRLKNDVQEYGMNTSQFIKYEVDFVESL